MNKNIQGDFRICISVPLTNTDFFGFIAVLVFKLLSRKVFFFVVVLNLRSLQARNQEFFRPGEFCSN